MQEFVLSNVEVTIRKHPNRFKELAEILDIIEKRIAKCTCGSTVKRENLRYFRPPISQFGIMIPYEDSPVWLYSDCDNCGNQYNYRKIRAWKAY